MVVIKATIKTRRLRATNHTVVVLEAIRLVHSNFKANISKAHQAASHRVASHKTTSNKAVSNREASNKEATSKAATSKVLLKEDGAAHSSVVPVVPLHLGLGLLEDSEVLLGLMALGPVDHRDRSRDSFRDNKDSILDNRVSTQDNRVDILDNRVDMVEAGIKC